MDGRAKMTFGESAKRGRTTKTTLSLATPAAGGETNNGGSILVVVREREREVHLRETLRHGKELVCDLALALSLSLSDKER